MSYQIPFWEQVVAIDAGRAPWHDVRRQYSGGVPTRLDFVAEPLSGKSREAHDAMMALLGDGMWHKRARITDVARGFGLSETTIWRLWHVMGVGESDSGRWLCIAREWTPNLAPDGT